MGVLGQGAPAKGLQREEQNFAQLWSTPAFSWVFDNKLFDELKVVVSPEAKGTMSPVWLIPPGCGMWLCSHSALGAGDSGDKLLWLVEQERGDTPVEFLSLHSQQEQKVALAAVQIQRAAGAPSLVIQHPSAVLLLFITDLESLHRSTQLLPYK